MTDLLLLLWAAIPPLIFLGYYYYRVPLAPPLSLLLWLFLVGAVSGFVALGLEYVFDTVANWVVNWQRMQRSLLGIALRQLIEIGPIEEGCKLLGVVVPNYYFQRRYRLPSSSVFLFTIAAALGFTAEENWIYLYHGTATVFDRSIGTPVHAMFSAPWGYALGRYLHAHERLNHYKNLFVRAGINSVIFHALVNVLSSAWRYSPPLRFLSYGLFPLFVWMFWRMEQLLRRVRGQRPLNLISGRTSQHRYWQRGLVLFALMLGGNAIFGIFLLARLLSPLSPSQIFSPDIFGFIVSRFLANFVFGILAWLIYLYLSYKDSDRYL
ncbi:PrsW family intramembrane metalloprotease [Anabaena subtropica]|uniref:PrsW family intramembrane metalloprotease n=1 Tax=Anabaena subtropica FACHB-260 TaxID=2692884 RepID=A0ABR8CL54_9NOST|nr:PrsW family glutamic-type intramembrane protease [Anabaena subtropica]MBD2343951.1 PrsW family intramembrane metalloprotease [Anabaena subtropica FACHB-260]